MEKKNMERKVLKESIPVWEWKGIPLIKISHDDFVTMYPVAKNVRSLNEAKNVASEFSENNNCLANVAYEKEWLKLIKFLEVNSAIKTFLQENDLTRNEVLLLDSISEGDTHVLAGGPLHCLNDIFRGFISGDDADGEPQHPKLVFLTLKIITD